MKHAQKILIVDDDDSTRKVLHNFFSNQGFHILQAAVADDALKYLKNERIDIVITDIIRVDRLKLEFIEKIKTLCNAKVIVLSGAIPDFFSYEECMNVGACEVFKKPAKFTDILNAIESKSKRRP